MCLTKYCWQSVLNCQVQFYLNLSTQTSEHTDVAICATILFSNTLNLHTHKRRYTKAAACMTLISISLNLPPEPVDTEYLIHILEKCRHRSRSESESNIFLNCKISSVRAASPNYLIAKPNHLHIVSLIGAILGFRCSLLM